MQRTANPPALRRRASDAVLFIVLVATGLTLGAGLAHLYALPNKISLPAEEYFTTQLAYRGWDLLAVVVLVQLLAYPALIWLTRRNRQVQRPVILAAAAWIIVQALFWKWTYPANVATQNWTEIPPDWSTLRIEWEYSHAAAAVVQLVAFGALIAAALRKGRPA